MDSDGLEPRHFPCTEQAIGRNAGGGCHITVTGCLRLARENPAVVGVTPPSEETGAQPLALCLAEVFHHVSKNCGVPGEPTDVRARVVVSVVRRRPDLPGLVNGEIPIITWR